MYIIRIHIAKSYQRLEPAFEEFILSLLKWEPDVMLDS